MVKYSMSGSEILRAEPKGFPQESGKISQCIPTQLGLYFHELPSRLSNAGPYGNIR